MTLSPEGSTPQRTHHNEEKSSKFIKHQSVMEASRTLGTVSSIRTVTNDTKIRNSILLPSITIDKRL